MARGCVNFNGAVGIFIYSAPWRAATELMRVRIKEMLMSSSISYRMFLCSSAPWHAAVLTSMKQREFLICSMPRHAAIAMMRIKLLSLVLLLFSTTVLGKTANTEQAHIADTIHILPRTGLALYPLYGVLHERLAVHYSYSMRQNDVGSLLPQYGLGEQKHKVYAAGATRKKKWGAHGNALYTFERRTKVRSVVMAQPELFYPYLLLDTSTRTLTRETYQSGGVLCYAWRDLGIAFGGSFVGITQFGKRDPRPLSRVGDFSTLFALSYRLPYYVLAAEGDYRYYSESFSLNNQKEDRQDYVYYLRGIGAYDHDLSVQKRSESVKYILSEYALSLQAAPQQRYFPFVQLSYDYNNAFGRTNVYTKVAETKEHKLQGRFLFPVVFGSQHIVAGVQGDYIQRTGYEIDYYTHLVNTQPNVTEEREYHRTAAWLGLQSACKGVLVYRYVFPSSQLYFAYEGGIASLNTNHGKHFFELTNLTQNLTAYYQLFCTRYDWSLKLRGGWMHPIAYRANWAQEAPFLEKLQRDLEYYYCKSYYNMQATLEVGYRFTAAQRIALAITGGYGHRGAPTGDAWNCEVALRYGFLNRR